MTGDKACSRCSGDLEVSGLEHRDGCRHRELSAIFGAAWEERRIVPCLCVVTVLSGVTGLFCEDLVNR